MLTTEDDGFTRVSCQTADLLRGNEKVAVLSSLTDLSGQFGEPEIFTEWGIERTDGSVAVVMREHRWPDQPDRDCEHWVPAPGFDWRRYHSEREEQEQ